MKFPDLPEDADAAARQHSPAAGITFACDDVDVPTGFSELATAAWLVQVAEQHGQLLDTLSYVFCSDEALHRINVDYLDHDTYTDIITFDLRDTPGEGALLGECYISLDRIEDNAARFGVSFLHELRRVLVHGLLHLTGLGDKTDAEATVMRAAEDAALGMWAG